MNKNNAKRFSFHFIFVMLLYLIIVIFSIMIISLGKNIYDNINEDRNINYELRVSLSYIANRIRQSDKNNSVELSQLHNIDAILINEIYDEDKYQTWIYFYEDGIYEMLTDEGSPFELSEGLKIIEIDSFEIEEIKNELFKLTAVSKGHSSHLYISLYSKEEAFYEE